MDRGRGACPSSPETPRAVPRGYSAGLPASCFRSTGLFWALLLWVPDLLAAQTPSSLRGTVSEARSAHLQGDYVVAERVYRALLRADPSSAVAMAGWGRALVAQGRGREAVSSLRRLAEQAIKRDDFAAATELLEVAVEASSEGVRERAEIRSRLGQVLALDRRYLSAEKILSDVWQSGLRDHLTLLYLASSLWENGKLEEAEARYREAVTLSARGTGRSGTGRSGAAVAHHQLGRFLLWRSQFAEAIEELERAAASGARGFDFELDRARALEGAAGTGETAPEQFIQDQAIRAFRGLVAIAPEHSQVRYGLARALLANGQREEAEVELAVFRELAAAEHEGTRREGIEQSQLNEVRLLMAEGRLDEALTSLDLLLRSVDTLRMRAVLLRSAGRHAEAAAALRDAISLAPGRQDLRSLLVELLAESESGPESDPGS